MLAERLKKETQQQHIAVEKLIIPRIKSLDSAHSYLKLLQIFYGYFQPLEEIINEHISDTVIADIKDRRKAAVIAEDMNFIDGGHQSYCTCTDLPSVTNTAEAIGAMYVLEGSTLGGVHLSKMIRDRVNLDSRKGLKFFNGYGDQTLSRWEAFKASVNSAAYDDKFEERVVDTANETFIKFKLWIENN
jgi:heme oxygenase